MEQTAVDSLIKSILPFVDRSKVSDMMLQDIASEHLAMFKEQIIQAAQYEPFLGDLPRTEGEHYYEKTFKTKD